MAMGGAFTMTQQERGEEQNKRVTELRHLQKKTTAAAAAAAVWITISAELQPPAMSSHSSILLLVTLWASMQDGLALPVMKQLEVEAGDGVSTHQVRTKRCACSNLLDSECHYFCHLDIIWINTPSKTTVYGLGGALSRRRRSTDRCTCANPDDQTCANFCSSEVNSLRRQLHMLSIIRSSSTLDGQDSAASSVAQRMNAR